VVVAATEVAVATVVTGRGDSGADGARDDSGNSGDK
jgi:hypothetical protein